MASRTSLSFLAVAVILGAAAFYALGLDNKVTDEPQEAQQETRRIVVENENSSQAQQKQAMQEGNEMSNLAPAAGEETAKKEEAPKSDAEADTHEHSAEAAKEEAPKSTKTPEQVLRDTALQIVYGNPDAPIKVVEYFSLSCPHCASLYKESQPKLLATYVDKGKVLYVKRYFPHNAPGLAATVLMQCVNNDKKADFLSALFNMQDKWAFTNDYKKNLQSIAEIGGMGPTDFEKCLSDKSIEESVLKQRQEALDVLKLDGIPTLFVNGVKLDGFSYSRLEEAIEKELKAAKE